MGEGGSGNHYANQHQYSANHNGGGGQGQDQPQQQEQKQTPLGKNSHEFRRSDSKSSTVPGSSSVSSKWVPPEVPRRTSSAMFTKSPSVNSSQGSLSLPSAAGLNDACLVESAPPRQLQQQQRSQTPNLPGYSVVASLMAVLPKREAEKQAESSEHPPDLNQLKLLKEQSQLLQYYQNLERIRMDEEKNELMRRTRGLGLLKKERRLLVRKKNLRKQRGILMRQKKDPIHSQDISRIISKQRIQQIQTMRKIKNRRLNMQSDSILFQMYFSSEKI